MKKTLDDQKSIQAKESMKTEDYFFNIRDLSRGIQRKLTEGVSTRIFPGEQAMLSVVSIEPNARGTIHSHPEEQWGFLLEGDGFRIQDGVEHPSRQGTSGRLRAALTTGSSADQKALKSWIFSALQGKNTVSPEKDILPQVELRQSTLESPSKSGKNFCLPVPVHSSFGRKKWTRDRLRRTPIQLTQKMPHQIPSMPHPWISIKNQKSSKGPNTSR